MNIPLNIDVHQILLHMLNFVILAGGLYLLLYGPVKQFIETRKNSYLQREEEFQRAEAAAKEAEAACLKRIEDMDRELEEEHSRRVQETEKTVAQMLENAKRQADEILSAAEAQAKKKRKAAEQELEHELVSLAENAMEKLMQESDSNLMDDFLQEAERGEPNA